MCRKFYTYMKDDVPGDVGAPSLDTTTNYLCCAIMLKGLPRFLVLQLQGAFYTESFFKIPDQLRKKHQLNKYQGPKFA